MNVSVILAAAGRSSRFQDLGLKKPFVPLAGRAVWLHTAELFQRRDEVRRLLILIGRDDRELFDRLFSADVEALKRSANRSSALEIELVEGGEERADSVERALARVPEEADLVAVHDAARPCVTDEQISRLFAAAAETGAAILAHPVAATLKRVGADDRIQETVPREGLWEAQTPQVFRRTLLVEAFSRRQGFRATDEAQLVERLGHLVTVVRGSPLNIKLTTQEDLLLAEAIKSRMNQSE